jgi:hypothetical protein
MIDGTGMCGGCRVTVGGKIRFACVDGPDFDGHEVDFDELMRRNSYYKAQERESANHECRIIKAGKAAEAAAEALTAGIETAASFTKEEK